MRDHEAAVLEADNPPLWRMIQRSAALTGQPVLQSAFDQYRKVRLEVGWHLWLPLFSPGRCCPLRTALSPTSVITNGTISMQSAAMQSLPNDPSSVPKKKNPGYCDGYFFRPACATHLLIGSRMMQQSGCDDPLATQQAVAAPQQRIHRQWTWDPCVVDVNIPHVLTLVEPGAVSSVKPIWLQCILAAQHPDGGWGGIDPLLTLPTGAVAADSVQRASRLPTPNPISTQRRKVSG